MEGLDRPIQRLDRARYHLADLSVKIEEFKRRDPYPITREADPEHGGYLFRVHVRESPPARLGLIFGDFVHNLRAALDNLVYEIAPPEARRRHPLAFPICRTPEQFRLEAPSKLAKMPRTVKETIERLQPYDGRDRRLRFLDVLDEFWNADKDRSTIPIALTSHVMIIGGWSEADQIPDVKPDFGSIYDGKVVGRMAANQPNMDQEPEFPIFLAFKENDPMVLAESLEEMYTFIRHTVVGQFSRLP